MKLSYNTEVPSHIVQNNIEIQKPFTSDIYKLVSVYTMKIIDYLVFITGYLIFTNGNIKFA